MTKLKEWFSRSWKWLAGLAVGLVLLLVLLWRKLFPPTLLVHQPGPSPKQREEDEKAQRAIDLARDEKDEKKDAVVAEHASQSNAVVHGLEQVTERVIDDPDATNDMLNSVKLFIHDD